MSMEGDRRALHRLTGVPMDIATTRHQNYSPAPLALTAKEIAASVPESERARVTGTRPIALIHTAAGLATMEADVTPRQVRPADLTPCWTPIEIAIAVLKASQRNVVADDGLQAGQNRGSRRVPLDRVPAEPRGPQAQRPPRIWAAAPDRGLSRVHLRRRPGVFASQLCDQSQRALRLWNH